MAFLSCRRPCVPQSCCRHDYRLCVVARRGCAAICAPRARVAALVQPPYVEAKIGSTGFCTSMEPLIIRCSCKMAEAWIWSRTFVGHHHWTAAMFFSDTKARKLCSPNKENLAQIRSPIFFRGPNKNSAHFSRFRGLDTLFCERRPWPQHLLLIVPTSGQILPAFVIPLAL